MSTDFRSYGGFFASFSFRQSKVSLFDGHAFGQVARFVDVAAELDREMVGEKLERDDTENRHHAVRDFWQRDNFIRDSFELLRTVAAGERDDGALAGFD